MEDRDGNAHMSIQDSAVDGAVMETLNGDVGMG